MLHWQSSTPSSLLSHDSILVLPVPSWRTRVHLSSCLVATVSPHWQPSWPSSPWSQDSMLVFPVPSWRTRVQRISVKRLRQVQPSSPSSQGTRLTLPVPSCSTLVHSRVWVMPPRLVESPLRCGVRWRTWGCASAVVARRAKAVWVKNFMLSEGLVIELGKDRTWS